MKQLLWLALALVAILFAVQGGEYSSLDLLRQRRQREQLVRAIDSLQHVVDSLGRYRDRMEHDPALQERIAREEFGMVRDKELLYRFAPPADSNRH